MLLQYTVPIRVKINAVLSGGVVATEDARPEGPQLEADRKHIFESFRAHKTHLEAII